MNIKISGTMISVIVGIVATFAVNFAQIQVNASDIENTEKTYEYIQEQLQDIQSFLRTEAHAHANDNDEEEEDD